METADELELSDYLSILRRRWRWVVAPLLAVVIAAVLFTVTQDKVYRSTASVLIGSSAAQDAVSGRSTNPQLLSRELSNEISYANSDQIEQTVEQRLGDLPEIEVEGDAEADLLRFTSTADTPEEAAEIANTWAEVYVAQKQADALASITAASDELGARLATLRQQRQELRAPLDDLQAQLAALPVDDDTGEPSDQARAAQLQAQIDQVEASLEPELDLIASQQAAVAETIATLQLRGELAAAGTARVVNRAAPPEQASNAPLSRNVALALVVGSILGVAAALLRENLDRGLKGPDDVLRLVDLPVLSAVPRASGKAAEGELGLATVYEPESAVADAYHKVRTALQFAAVNQPIRSVLVTSANQGEGKTVSSANLAWAMASAMDQVVLLDGDFRRPRLHQVYGAANDAGLSDHVLSGAPVDDLAVRVESPAGNLWVLRTGPLPPNPSDFVASRAFATALQGLTDVDGRLVVVDGPPVLPVSDALTLARLVDVVVLTAFADRTTSDDLLRARQALEQVGAEVLGVVLVAVREQESYYRYGYYSSDAGAARHQAERPDIRMPAVVASRNGEARRGAAAPDGNAVDGGGTARRGMRLSTKHTQG